MDYTQQPIRHLSVCTGYEGIGLGLRRIFPGLREIAYVEIEAFAIANLVSKAEEGKLDPAPVYTDVESFPFRQFRGKVDILSGGFPCQPFSVAGNQQGTDDERHLYPFISAGIRECQPTIVFLENVPGIVSTKLPSGESVLQYVLRDLESMGYTATSGFFSAEEVSAPHRRERVFILAYAESERHRGGRDEERGVDGWFVQPHEQGRSEVGSETKGRSGELADSDGSRGGEDREPSQLRTVGTQQSPIHPGRTDSEEGKKGRQSELAHPDSQGLEGVESRINPTKEWTDAVQPVGLQGRADFEWPARPGNEPHEWEEPRTTQRRLGRAVDGADSGVDPVKFRVERIHLIGNGVIPQVAERAYRVLAERLRGES
jgi:DNA (cytosine-5)-methyltransferase 1